MTWSANASSCHRNRNSPSSRISAPRAVTIESQSKIADFDVFAFSVSFEWDYTNVITMLRLAGMPAYAAERCQGIRSS